MNITVEVERTDGLLYADKLPFGNMGEWQLWVEH